MISKTCVAEASPRSALPPPAEAQLSARHRARGQGVCEGQVGRRIKGMMRASVGSG